MLAHHTLGSTILCWGFPGQSFENAIKLGKRLKSRGERDVTDSQITIVQESARFLESRACDVIDKVRPGYLLEFFAEIIRVNVCRFRHPRERKFFTRMFLDKLPRFPNFHGFGSMVWNRLFESRRQRHLNHPESNSAFFRCRRFSSLGNFSPDLVLTEKLAESRVNNFCKEKGKECGARDPSPPYKVHKGVKYGIPDSSCRRINGGALRAHHRRLPETARMVNRQPQMRSDKHEDVIKTSQYRGAARA